MTDLTQSTERYCDQCCSYVPVDYSGEPVCSLCNPGTLAEDDLQELDFSDELYDRILDPDEEDE